MPCGPRAFDAELRAIARAHISDGRLPVMSAHAVFAGYGSGTGCHLCGQPIERHQVEYEVRDARNARSLSFHLTCHAAWQLECLDHVSRANGAPQHP